MLSNEVPQQEGIRMTVETCQFELKTSRTDMSRFTVCIKEEGLEM